MLSRPAVGLEIDFIMLLWDSFRNSWVILPALRWYGVIYKVMWYSLMILLETLEDSPEILYRSPITSADWRVLYRLLNKVKNQGRAAAFRPSWNATGWSYCARRMNLVYACGFVLSAAKHWPQLVPRHCPKINTNATIIFLLAFQQRMRVFLRFLLSFISRSLQSYRVPISIFPLNSLLFHFLSSLSLFLLPILLVNSIRYHHKQLIEIARPTFISDLIETVSEIYQESIVDDSIAERKFFSFPDDFCVKYLIVVPRRKNKNNNNNNNNSNR